MLDYISPFQGFQFTLHSPPLSYITTIPFSAVFVTGKLFYYLTHDHTFVSKHGSHTVPQDTHLLLLMRITDPQNNSYTPSPGFTSHPLTAHLTQATMLVINPHKPDPPTCQHPYRGADLFGTCFCTTNFSNAPTRL
jgi:hypothetical protein